MTEQKITNIEDADINYYELKNRYENVFYNKYVKEIVTSNISKKEKKRLFQKLPKPNCVNCNRNVGTIFTIKQNEKGTNRLYKAFCGDISNPCPLNIQIEMPTIETYSNI
jgi:transcription elongation factor Elf1